MNTASPNADLGDSSEGSWNWDPAIYRGDPACLFKPRPNPRCCRHLGKGLAGGSSVSQTLSKAKGRGCEPYTALPFPPLPDSWQLAHLLPLDSLHCLAPGPPLHNNPCCATQPPCHLSLLSSLLSVPPFLKFPRSQTQTKTNTKPTTLSLFCLL